MTAQRTDEARAIARTVIQRVVHNPAYAAHLRADPRATLLNAGLPDWAVDDFMIYDLGIEPDVSGYVLEGCAVTSLLSWSDEDGLQSNQESRTHGLGPMNKAPLSA